MFLSNTTSERSLSASRGSWRVQNFSLKGSEKNSSHQLYQSNMKLIVLVAAAATTVTARRVITPAPGFINK